jgi:hypothetical protein
MPYVGAAETFTHTLNNVTITVSWLTRFTTHTHSLISCERINGRIGLRKEEGRR